MLLLFALLVASTVGVEVPADKQYIEGSPWSSDCMC